MKCFLNLFILLSFIFNMFLPYRASAQAITPYGLPQPQQLLTTSKVYSYPVLKGIKINPDNPAYLEFIIDAKGRSNIDRQELSRLVSYFLACLTIPEADLWVNLSPYEQNRITSEKLAQTDLGKDMLGEDYILKQLASSLTYPESESGKAYWQSIQGRDAIYRVRDNNFQKVWIVPDKALIYEHNGTAVVKDSQLKVMMEEDFAAVQKNNDRVGANPCVRPGQTRGSAPTDAFRMHVLPLIEKEVNTGENFARLRQIHNAFLLAAWFKKKLKDSAYKYYIDQGKVKGIDLKDKNVKENIYNLYVDAFKKGAYDYIKKEHTQNKISKRRYFSGGVIEKDEGTIVKDDPRGVQDGQRNTGDAGVLIVPNGTGDGKVFGGHVEPRDIATFELAQCEPGDAKAQLAQNIANKFRALNDLFAKYVGPADFWGRAAFKAYLFSGWPLKHAARIILVKWHDGNWSEFDAMLRLVTAYIAFKYGFLTDESFSNLVEAFKFYAKAKDDADFDAAEAMLAKNFGGDVSKAKAIFRDAENEFRTSPDVDESHNAAIQILILRMGRPERFEAILPVVTTPLSVREPFEGAMKTTDVVRGRKDEVGTAAEKIYRYLLRRMREQNYKHMPLILPRGWKIPVDLFSAAVERINAMPNGKLVIKKGGDAGIEGYRVSYRKYKDKRAIIDYRLHQMLGVNALKRSDVPQPGAYEDVKVPNGIKASWLRRAYVEIQKFRTDFKYTSPNYGAIYWINGGFVQNVIIEDSDEDPMPAGINAWHHYDPADKSILITVVRRGLSPEVRRAAVNLHEPYEATWQVKINERKDEEGVKAFLAQPLNGTKVTLDRIAHTLASADERRGQQELVAYDKMQIAEIVKDPVRLTRMLSENDRTMQHEWVGYFMGGDARRETEAYDAMYYAELQAEADRVGGIALTSKTADIQTQGDFNVKMPDKLAKEFESSDGAGFRIVFIGAKLSR